MAKRQKKTDQGHLEFARTRSHEAAKIAYDLCKTIAQTCLVINGAAATAVVALLGKDKIDQSILTFVPFGLVGYAIGVILSAYMLYCVMMMADHWNFYWAEYAYDGTEENADAYADIANGWQKWMNRIFALAIVCFAVSSTLVAIGMARATPTIQTTSQVLPK